MHERDDMKSADKVATGHELRNLEDVERTLLAEGAARDKLELLLEFARSGAPDRDLHEVERELFAGVLNLGLLLLNVVLAEKGTGKMPAGETTRARTGEELPYHSIKTVSYLSVFGEASIRRAYYWRKGATEGCCPLDGELNLPERRFSYLLQEWGAQLGAGGSFEKVTERIETFLGVKFWSQGVQDVARAAACDAQNFYDQKAAPAKKTEGELLVATVDGKGVPIRSEELQGEKIRLGKGEKPGKKKEAIVSAVYTVDRFPRTAEDVIRDIDRDNRVVKPDPPPPPRPRPKNKRLRATLGGKDRAFAEVRRQLDQRDPKGEKQRIALTDGAGSLQQRVLSELQGESGIVLILDIMHVLTYLWPVANAYHEEGTAEASRWVMNKLRLLLEGKVGYVIGSLRSRVGRGGLSRSRREKFQNAIRYMERNRGFMAYDVYLRNGYPIGSGVVEGACKHLVKDRMECTGMRWSMAGAQSILELRAVDLNGDWKEFWRYHVAQQRRLLYSERRPGTDLKVA